MDFMFGGNEGFDFGNIFAAGAAEAAPKKEGKKPAKKESSEKADEKKPEKKSGGKKKKGADVSVSMPVTVLARGFKCEVSELGVIKMSELLTKLDGMGYHEVRQPSAGAVYDVLKNTVYITSKPDAACKEDVQVSSFPVTISDGHVKCELTLDNFDGYEEGEVSVAELLDYWVSVNPNYEGCRLAYAGNYAYPVFDHMLEPKTNVSFPCTFIINGEEKEFDETEFADTTAGTIVKKLFGESDGNVSAGLVSNLDKSHYYLVYRDVKNTAIKKPFEEVSSNSGATVEKKYKLPLKVFIASFNLQEELTSEKFDGKEKVTLDEIKGYYGTRYRIFNDKSRTLDSIYLEEDNMLSLMFISGKKGAYAGAFGEIRERFGTHELLRTIGEFKEALKKPFFQGTLVNSDESVRVENLPHGIFTAKIDTEKGTLSDLKFERKLPKIPMNILVEVVDFFREDLSKEAWVKIIYDSEAERYSIFKGTQSASKSMVTYAMDSLAELYADGKGQKIIQVMEIHSHNVMPAFFSYVDDSDEIYPGLFGVVGRLNEEIPQFKFRAGMEGIFTEVDGAELFTL